MRIETIHGSLHGSFIVSVDHILPKHHQPGSNNFVLISERENSGGTPDDQQKALLLALDETTRHLKRLNNYLSDRSVERADRAGDESPEFEIISEATSAASHANESLAETGQAIRDFNDWLASKAARLGDGK